MAPLDAASYADGSPTAQHAALLEARTAAKRATQTQQVQSFRPNSAAEDLALRSEAYLSPGERYRAERRRAQVSAGIGAPTAPPLVLPANIGEEGAEADPQMLDQYNNAWMAMESQNRLREQYADPVYRAQARRIAQQARAQAASATANLRNEIVSDIWTGVFQGSGYLDAPCEDGSIMLHVGTAGTLYQTVLTLEVFPQLNAAVDNNAMLKSALPQKYDLRTSRGWGQLTSGVILLLWYSIAIVILLAILITLAMPFIAAGNVYERIQRLNPFSDTTTTTETPKLDD